MVLLKSNNIVGKKDKHWIRYIKRRIIKNKNFLGFIGGCTGSGKSYSTLSIGEQIDPNFGIDNVVFSGIELMDLINSGKLKKGSCIAFEEAGVGMSSRNWQSVTNKMISYLLQTFRHKNFILLMNSPYMDFVDVSTRKLFHAEMVTTGIDFEKEEVKLKPQLIQYNARMKKFYYKRLIILDSDGARPITIWRVGKPSQELITAYEAKKKAFTERLNKQIYHELQQQKKTKEPKPEVECKICGNKWSPRSEKPSRCPKCGSWKWNIGDFPKETALAHTQKQPP